MQRWSRRAVLVGFGGGLLAACTNGQAAGNPYSASVAGDGNRVTLDTDASGQRYVVNVQSERGIGEASFAWWGKALPHPLTFDLKLSGLEHFRLAWAANIVNVSVNSSDNAVIQWAQGSDQVEVQIAPDSPYWLPVQVPSQAMQGYQLSVPPAFIAAAPRLWAIAWVDFYR
jgi:hypothetical protein